MEIPFIWRIVSCILPRQSGGTIGICHSMPSVGDRLRRQWIDMTGERDLISNEKGSAGRVS